MNHSLIRSAIILASAGCLSACASTYEPFEGQGPAGSQGQGQTMRPQYPINRSAEAAPPPAATPPYTPARPTAPIEGRSLPPTSGSNQPGYVTPSTPPYQPPSSPPPAYRPLPSAPPPEPPPTYQEAPPPPPAPIPTKTVTRTSVTGKVVEIEGPRLSYTVKKGDNLDAIGRKFDLDRKTLAELNDLKSPYRLQPGDELKGPKTKAKAYVVGSGDTLSSIARRFSVTAKALAAENDLKPSANLKPGRKLTLPEGYKDKGPIKTTERVPAPELAPPPMRPAPPPAYVPPRPTYTPPPSLPPVTRPQPAPPPVYVPPTPQPPRPPAPAIIPTQPSATDAEISQLGRGRFIWPVRGDIISTFGVKGTGSRNDGVDIRAAAGEPVRAAAAGDVVYAGDQVPGFGNLVLVKHADGWVTAYGHLARSDVKMQQKVVQGQQLGSVGQTGGASEPKLHFEVRYAPTPVDRAKPIDPALVLPR